MRPQSLFILLVVELCRCLPPCPWAWKWAWQAAGGLACQREGGRKTAALPRAAFLAFLFPLHRMIPPPFAVRSSSTPPTRCHRAWLFFGGGACKRRQQFCRAEQPTWPRKALLGVHTLGPPASGFSHSGHSETRHQTPFRNWPSLFATQPACWEGSFYGGVNGCIPWFLLVIL